jgi:hypothetical protein
MSSRGRRAASAIKGQMYTQLMVINDHTLDSTEQDDIVNVTVHHDAILRAVKMIGSLTAAANNDYFVAELSDAGNFQGFSNDNMNTILILGSRFILITSGATNMHVETIKEDLDIKFIAGDRLFINAIGTNTKNLDLWAILYWEAI